MSNITYLGKDYPAKEVNIPDYGYNLISTESLESELIVGMDAGYSVARNIDDDILFYVPDDIISLPDEKVADYICRNIA